MISQGTNDNTNRSGKKPVSRPNASQGSSGPRSASGRPAASGPRSTSGRPAASGPRPASGQRPAPAQRRAQPGGTDRKRKKRVSPLFITLIAALVLAIAAFAGVGIYALRYSNYDKIMPNVYVAGIDVGGMTKEEAKAAIETALTNTTQQSLDVILPDQVLTFAPQQDTVVIDVDSAVDSAYAYGRKSTSPFAIARAIKAAQRRRNDIDLSTSIQVDQNYISDLINSTATAASTKLTESTVDTDLVSHTITVTIGTPGKTLDTEKLYDLVYNAFINGDYSDIEFDYDMVYPATVQLDKLYAELTTEPVNASYNPETQDVDPEMPGYTPTTALDKANEQLAMAAPGDVLTFTFDETPAEVTAEQLSSLLFTDLLADCGGYLTSNSGRTKNIELACEAIDGTILLPGDVFSFNKTVGERTADKGYKEAIVYVSGKSEQELGGGVCQVASEIYYAAMYADLEIVERTEHAFTVDYVPGGLDATVYFGSLDFQFRNSTDYPIRIDAYISNGKCWIDLYGTNITGQYVEIESERVATVPFSTYETTDPSKVQSGYTGETWEITRYVYDKDGNLIRTDTTEALDNLSPSLGTSVYAKRDKYVLASTATPSPSPSTEPSTSPSEEPTTPPSEEPTTPPSEEPTTPPSEEPTTPPSETTPDPVPPTDTGGSTGE